MRIRKARVEELSKLLQIYDDARKYMRAHGNAEQWSGGYPGKDVLLADIHKEALYVCTEDDESEILGAFCYFEGIDPTYVNIYDGTWLNDRPYGVIHRIAVAVHQRGVASFCFDHCFSRCKNLKIDTHRDNIPMQRALEKNGFVRCGIIYLENGAPRIAFQRCVDQ